MRIITLLLIIISWLSCTGSAQVKNEAIETKDSVNEDLTYNIQVLTLNKDSVQVIFRNTSINPNKEQLELLRQIKNRQGELHAKILVGIFNYYKDVRKDYAKGIAIDEIHDGKLSKELLESILPTAKSKEYLRGFYHIVVIHIPQKVDLLNPEFVIEYDCDWEIENGMVSIFRNWEISEVGTAEMHY